MAKALYEEVIDEIGTQTLARLGLNIFSLNTYAAYGASVVATMEASRSYNQHKNNKASFGQTFEELDVGKSNIIDFLQNNGNKTYTTDTLAEIKKTREILASSKKIENLNEKDRAKFQYILSVYGDEVENLDFKKLAYLEASNIDKNGKNNNSLKNHTTTDVVTLDKNGNVIKTAQLKVIKNTDGLLEDRYLYGKNAPDELKMPFDDYKRHKQNLESMIEKAQQNPSDEKAVAKAEKAKTALEKLNENNTCNRIMAENPRTSAIVTQSVVASGHILQAGMSDAIVVALSTLANGIMWEVKDAFNGKIDSETSVLERVKRLLKKVIESFKSNFVRGAGFGAIDALVGVIGQIFKSVLGAIRRIWGALRESAKSVYNAIYSYVKGEIQSTTDVIKTIIKAIFSALWVSGAIGLEKSLETSIATLIPPLAFLAPFIAPILAIVVAAFGVVMSARGVDMVIDSLCGIFAARDKAKQRAEEIADLIMQALPALINERERLAELIESSHKERTQKISALLCEVKDTYSNDGDMYDALNGICTLYNETLSVKDMNDVKELLHEPKTTGKLQWSGT